MAKLAKAQKAVDIRRRSSREWPSRLMTDEEEASFMRESGLTYEMLRDALELKGMAKASTKRGRGYRLYRKEMKTDGLRRSVNLLKLWMSIYNARKMDDFDWDDFVAGALYLPQTTLVEEWRGKIEGLVEEMEKEGGLRALIESSKKTKLTKEQFLMTKESLRSLDIIEPLDGSCGAKSSDSGHSLQHSKKRHKKEDKRSATIVERIMEDVLLGLGLSESAITKATANEQAVELGVFEFGTDVKLSELLRKIKNQKTTFRQYAAYFNLFLLWANDKSPEMFRDKGAVLATPASIYAFLQDYEKGLVRLSGKDPFFGDVVLGRVKFKAQTCSTRLGAQTIKKIINALATLSTAQHDLLGLPTDKLRDCPTIKNYEWNVASGQATLRRKNNEDRQQHIMVTQNVIQDKKTHSIHLLCAGNIGSIRLRALSLCQTFSVGRFDEISKWEMADLSCFTYEAGIGSLGTQPIQVLTIAQHFHKMAKDGAPPDTKILCRHKDITLCPLNALALYFFYRFVMLDEKDIPFERDKSQWYKIKVFRSMEDRTKGVNSKSIYGQRQRLMEDTETFAFGAGTHQDRHCGAAICRLYNIPEIEIERLGLWDVSTMQKFYLKIRPVDTIAKLSGFSNPSQYKIERAKYDPFSHPEFDQSRELFHGFMSFLDKPFSSKGAASSARSRHHAFENCLSALRFIRLIFWQDVAVLYRLYPDLKVFKSSLINRNIEVFKRWVEVVCDRNCTMVDENEPLVHVGNNEKNVDDLEAQVIFSKQLEELSKQQEISSLKLDLLLAKQSNSGKQCTNSSSQNMKPDDYTHTTNCILQSLQKLDDLGIEGVFNQWISKFWSQGVEFRPLRDLETGRQKLHKKYYVPSLKSTIRRRRDICIWIEKLASRLESIPLAIEEAKRIQRQLGSNGELISMHGLWMWIRGYSRDTTV